MTGIFTSAYLLRRLIFFLKAVVNSNIASQHQRENIDHYKSTMDHPKLIVSNQKAGLNKNCFFRNLVEYQ